MSSTSTMYEFVAPSKGLLSVLPLLRHVEQVIDMVCDRF